MGSQPNRSLADGLLCLQALAAAGEPVGCRELGRELGLHHVKTNRMLMGLAEAGFATRDEHGRYAAGPALHVLAALATFGSGLLQRAMPELQVLHRRTAAVVALGVRWRDRVCYLYHGRRTAEALGRTQLYPATTSSIGLALLAQAPREELDELYPRAAPGFASPAALRRELAGVRRRGHAALRHGEAARPHHSLAVAIGDPATAAVAVTGIPLENDPAPALERLHAAAAAIAGTDP